MTLPNFYVNPGKVKYLLEVHARRVSGDIELTPEESIDMLMADTIYGPEWITWSVSGMKRLRAERNRAGLRT